MFHRQAKNKIQCLNDGNGHMIHRQQALGNKYNCVFKDLMTITHYNAVNPDLN